jgi:hypothetical protein
VRVTYIPLPVISTLIELTNDLGIEASEKDSLLGGLRELRKESISKSCKRFLAQHLGNSAASQFDDYYYIRSHMLHDGKEPRGVDLSKSVNDLDNLVSSLLIAAIAG